MKRKDAFGSVGAAAICATLMASVAHAETAGTQPQAAPIEAVGAAVAGPSDADAASAKDPIVAVPKGRWAIGVAVGTVMAAFVSLVGFNGVLRAFAAAGRSAARTAAASAEIPVKAAKAAFRSAGRVLKTPARWALGTAAVTTALVVTVVLLDIQWKAGLAVGVAGALGSVAGIKHLRRRRPRSTEFA